MLTPRHSRTIATHATAALLLALLPAACAQPRRAALEMRAAQRHQAASIARGVPSPPRTVIERDIPYGPDPAQRLDVYRPAHAAHAPVIFMVHGGGWTRGDKAATNVVTNKVRYWLPRGYVFVSVNYRLSPKANPIEEAADVARALAFAQHRAASWGGDASRFVVMGHSAGAHLVSLITADPSIATRQGAAPWLGTVSLDGAGYNIVEIMRSPRHLPLYDPVFTNDTTLWREASPTLRLERVPVPMLLVCSTRRIVSCPQAREFAAKAMSLGGRVTVLPVDLTHEEINRLLGAGGDYTSEVESFMRSLGLP